MNPSGSGWVTVAVLGKPRGNRGELTAFALSDKPERFQALRRVHLFGGRYEHPEDFEVESAWFHGGTLILKFRTIDTISDAERLAGAEVRVPMAERVPLDPGEYFQSDLIGCEVVERRSGEPIGRVTGWEDSGSTGMLVVEGGVLIPFARSICVVINPASRRIEVDLPEGLKDLNRP